MFNKNLANSLNSCEIFTTIGHVKIIVDREINGFDIDLYFRMTKKP